MTFDNVVHYLHPPSFTPKVPVECPNCQSPLFTIDNKQVAQNPVDPTIPTQRKRCPKLFITAPTPNPEQDALSENTVKFVWTEVTMCAKTNQLVFLLSV